MTDSDTFAKNIERWAVSSPAMATRLKNFKCSHTTPCQAANGEENLEIKKGDKCFLLHSSDNPSKEAKEWFASLSLRNVTTIYVYGIGLGYFYDAAWEWLRQDLQRNLVILEDDLEVLCHLFKTSRATQILFDRQVYLHYVGVDNPDYGTFDKFLANFSLCDYLITQLKAYADHRPYETASLKGRVSFFLVMNRFNTAEYNNFGMGFFNNYFRDLFHLPMAYFGNGLYDQFKGIPAIICGAGPSLEKNIDQLEALKDKALIFSGGTGLNALDTQHVTPHFGVGIDPNPEQFTRLVMQQSYEVPFFYRNRINYEALNIVHGEKIYLTGSGGYFTARWFENKLGIEGREVNEGCNVLNFSLSIAHALGCNPIIFVGLDLAYSKGHSYKPGIISHPIHDRKSSFRTKTSQDELLIKEDIYGEQVYTLWKWMAESIWYTQYAKDNPDVRLVNCTEGGIGFPGIVNMKLEDAARLYLQKSYDLDTLVHGAMQNSHFPQKITPQKLKEMMQELSDELLKCWEICHYLYAALDSAYKKAEAESAEPDESVKNKTKEQISRLREEPGYAHLLNVFDDAFSRAWGFELLRLKYDEGVVPQKEIDINSMHLEALRYGYLKQTALMNSALIRDILSNYDTSQQKISELPKPERHKPKDIEIVPLLKEPLTTEPERTYYPNGALKSECYYKDGVLHGPSSYFTEKGQLLSLSWFVEGLRQGKKKTYYADGALHSIQNFRQGKRHGHQEYFYQNGMTRSLLPYIDGLLHGFLYLYHSNGILARTNHYEKGKRHGIEKIWDETGTLLIEAEYLEDQAVGTAKQWYPNGVLAKQVKFDKESKRCLVQRWNEMGIAIEEERFFGDDYFDKVTKQTTKLTDSLAQVLDQLNRLSPLINKSLQGEKKPALSFEEDLQSIRQQITRLQELSKELTIESGLDADNPMESLWKSPTTQRTIEKKLEILNIQMTEEIKIIEKGLHTIVNELFKLEKGK